MVMKVSVVSATAANGTPTYTQDFTDSGVFGGVTPKAAIILATSATVENTNKAGVQFSIGFIAGTTKASVGASVDDASSPCKAGWASNATQVYSPPDFSGGTIGDATATLIADGVRLSWTDQSVGEIVKVILIGGDVEAGLVSLTSNNGTSAQTVTHGLSAAPEAIIALSVGQAAGASAGDARLDFGFYAGGTQQGMSVRLDGNALTTVAANGYLDSTHALVDKVAGGSGINWNGTIGNLTATQFDVTYSANHTKQAHFLSLRSTSGTALSVATGVLTTKTSTGNNADITGMSLSPQLVLYGLSRTIAINTSYSGVDDASNFGVGVALVNSGSGATQYATTICSDNDASATSGTHAHSQTSNTEAIRILDANDGTADIEATVNSWDAGGVTHNYSNINATGRKIIYLAIGADVVTRRNPFIGKFGFPFRGKL